MREAVERIQPLAVRFVGYVMQGTTLAIAFKWPNGTVEVFDCQVRRKAVTA
jgi:hypothetical protein